MCPLNETQQDNFDSAKARKAFLRYQALSTMPTLFKLLDDRHTRSITWEKIHKLKQADLKACLDALTKRVVFSIHCPLEILCQDKTFFLDFLTQVQELDTSLTENEHLDIFKVLTAQISGNKYNSLLGQYLSDPSTAKPTFEFLNRTKLLSDPLSKNAFITVCLNDKMDLKGPESAEQTINEIYTFAIDMLVEKTPDGPRLYNICQTASLQARVLKWLAHRAVLDSKYGDKVFEALTRRVLDTSSTPHRLISPLSYLLCQLGKYPEYRTLLSHPRLVAHTRYLNYLFDIIDRKSLGIKDLSCQAETKRSFDEEILTRIQTVLEKPDKHYDLNTLTATGLPLIAAAAKHGRPALVSKMMALGGDITLPYHWSSLHYHTLFSVQRLFRRKRDGQAIELTIPKTLCGIKHPHPTSISGRLSADVLTISARPGLLPLKSFDRVHTGEPAKNRILHLTHGHHFERGALINRYGFLTSTSSELNKLKRKLSEINRQVITILTFGPANSADRLSETGLTSFAVSYRDTPLYMVKTKNRTRHKVSSVYYEDGFFPANTFAINFVDKHYRILEAFFTTQIASYYKAGNCETHRDIAFTSLCFAVDQSNIQSISLVTQETREGNHFFVLLNAGKEKKVPGCHALPDSAILVDPYLDIVATKKDILRKYHSNYYGEIKQKCIVSTTNYTVRDKLELLLVQSHVFLAYAISHDEPIQQLALGFAEPLMRHATNNKTVPDYPIISKTLAHIRLLEECVAYHATFTHLGKHPFIYQSKDAPYSKEVKASYWLLITEANLSLSRPTFVFEQTKINSLNAEVALKKCKLLKRHIDELISSEAMSDKLADFIDIRACHAFISGLAQSKTPYFQSERQQQQFESLELAIMPWLVQHIEKQDKVSEAGHPPTRGPQMIPGSIP